jgi:hypothetical protein
MMKDWQDIGYNLEAKIATNGEIWVRNNWQTRDYPNIIIELDSQGAIINFRTSDGSHGGSIESRYAIALLVKEKLLQP